MQACEKNCILAKRLKFASWMISLALFASCVDVLLGAGAMFTDKVLPIAIIASAITLSIICTGYGLYNQLGKSPTCLAYHRDKGNALRLVFSKSNIVLSITDIFVGILALVLVKWLPADASNILTFATGINIIKTTKIALNSYAVKVQIKKLKNFVQMTKEANINKDKRRLKVKAFFKWIFKSNPKTITALITIAGAIGLALIGATQGWLESTQLSWLVEILSPILGVLGTALAGWAGLEWNTTADARKQVEANLAKAKEAAKQLEAEIKAKALETARAEIAKIQAATTANVALTVPTPPASPNE